MEFKSKSGKNGGGKGKGEKGEMVRGAEHKKRERKGKEVGIGEKGDGEKSGHSTVVEEEKYSKPPTYVVYLLCKLHIHETAHGNRDPSVFNKRRHIQYSIYSIRKNAQVHLH